MVGSKARVVLLLLLTFAAGTAAGVAADRLNLLPGIAQAEEGEREDRRPDRRRRGGQTGQTTIERFADDLGLTGDQRSEIEGILDGYRSSMRRVWGEVQPRYRSLVDSARTQIEALLTPEQVEQYRELLRERYRGSPEERDRESGQDRDDPGSDGRGS